MSAGQHERQGAQPEITAVRHTAYALAGLQDCNDCGRPGWSIDGVNVLKHERDADNDACPMAKAKATLIAGWLMGLETP